jgi:alkylation response protein AidB-like acyl-CoA dehydrogenase
VSDVGDELAASLRRMLRERVPLARVRRVIDGDEAAADTWRDLVDLGLPALAVPGSHGGDDAGWSSLVRVYEELGRALYPGPFLSTIGLALPVLLAGAAEEAATRLLPAVASGKLTLALAVSEPDSPGWALTGSPAPDEDGRLTVNKGHVVGAAEAGAVLVVATDGSTAQLYLVATDGPGVEIVAHPSVDLTRPVSTVALAGAPAELISRPGLSADDVRSALDVSRLAVAADALGAAQACLDMAVAYAKDRVQFGHPIGSFQAIKHLCADMLLRVEGARSAVYAAAASLDTDASDAAAYACLAKAVATDVLRGAARDNIQIHGALGFTWEHDAHLFYRRGIADELLLGDAVQHRERMATLLGV